MVFLSDRANRGTSARSVLFYRLIYLLMDVYVIGIDADDTLWPTSHLYDSAIYEFAKLMSDVADVNTLSNDILNLHKTNAKTFGYGSLPMMMTLTEAACKLTHNANSERLKEIYNWIVETCRDIHEAPIEPYPGVAEALSFLKENEQTLILISKGVHAEQMSKINRSGLEDFFDGVVIASHKTADIYSGIVTSMGIEPHNFLMIGDSINSDILPVIEIGGVAVLNGSKKNWEDAGALLPDGVQTVESLAEFPGLLYDDYEIPLDVSAVHSSQDTDDKQSMPASSHGTHDETSVQSNQEVSAPQNEDIEDPPHGQSDPQGTDINEHPALQDAFRSQSSHKDDSPSVSEDMLTGKWSRLEHGRGYGVLLSELYPIRSVHKVKVIRSTGEHSIRKVEIVSNDEDENTSLGYVIGHDGKPAPIQGGPSRQN